VVPCLAELCLRVPLAHYGTGADILVKLVPYLTPHHRKRIMRIYAVQSPLSNASLRVLSLPAMTYRGRQYNQADSKLVIVEPVQPPTSGALPRRTMTAVPSSGKWRRRGEGRWWDAKAGDDGDGDRLGSHWQPLTVSRNHVHLSADHYPARSPAFASAPRPRLLDHAGATAPTAG
jgi:hypothetical protein